VVFVDLDGFKAVNDLHGHGAGDEVLREVARRMRRCLRESDTLSRLGGDEFVVLTQGVSTVQQLQALTDKLRAEIQLAYVVPTIQAQGITKVWVDASMGATFFPPADLRAEDLLNSADEAMYRAKRSGRSLEMGVLQGSAMVGLDEASAA
jgi:diguanylate cyclase (GGDEF)-like protein